MPKLLIRASLTAKVLLLLQYLHLPPTPPLLVVHKISLPTSFTPHTLVCCQPGHTVRFAVWLPLFFPPLSIRYGFVSTTFQLAPSLPLLFALSFLIRGFLLSPSISSHILLWFRPASLHLSCLFSDLSIPPFSGQPGHTVRLANFLLLYALLYALAFLSSPALLPLPALPLLLPSLSFLLLLSQPLTRLKRCLPKVALPNVATPYVAMTQSGRLSPCRELCALTPPMILKRLHAAFPMCRLQSWCQLCCWMPRTTCYYTPFFLGTLPTTNWCSLYHLIYRQISPLLSLDSPHVTPLSFTDGVGNGVTSLWHTVRLVLLSSSTSSLLIYFCTPPHGSSTAKLFCSSSFILSPFVLSHTSRPDISNGNGALYPIVYTFTGSFLNLILLMIFPCFPLRNPLLHPLPLHPTLSGFSLHVLFSYPPHSLLTPPPLRRPLRIVTFFERLPSCRAFCCHYFEPLLE